MNKKSLGSGRAALNVVAAAALWLSASMAYGMGLGRLSVQSALGETLRAEIDVSSLSAEEAANLQARIASPDAYRSAGVDYNPVLPSTQAVLMRRPDGRPYLRLSSDRPVQEPFVDVILEISWSTGRLVREYTLLFDPPARLPPSNMAALPSTAPAISAAPQPRAAPRRRQPRRSAASPRRRQGRKPRPRRKTGRSRRRPLRRRHRLPCLPLCRFPHRGHRSPRHRLRRRVRPRLRRQARRRLQLPRP